MRLGAEIARKRFVVAVLAGILLIPQMSFAGMNLAAAVGGYFIKNTSTEGEARVYATYLSPRKVVSKVSLEEALEGTTNYTTVEGPYTKTYYNVSSVSRLFYFDLDEGYDYRVKFQVTDTLEGIESTVTHYFDLEDAEE